MIVSKYADHLPLHRQLKMLRRVGVDLSDKTIWGRMGQCADFQPLYGRLKGFVLESKVVGNDNTQVNVLGRSLPPAHKGRIGPYAGDRDYPAVVYDYTATRERAGRRSLWKTIAGICRPTATWRTTVCSTVIFTALWKTIARKWVPCCS